MRTHECEIGHNEKMVGLHCKTRRNTYAVVGALILISLLIIGVLSIIPSTADDTNPVVQNTAAPELIGSEWLNTSNHQPIRLADRKGKITLVHFWTFGCINCKHNLPAYARLQKQFAGKDVAVIGVHTPETAGEANLANVRAAVRKDGITYPVLVDNGHKNWSRWNQQFWPTVYLIDRHGNIRYRWEGELEYNGQNGERRIADLLDSLLIEK
jgi:thiol-disulfide isomerase/thioredoxin